jgi:hypothetical protein
MAVCYLVLCDNCSKKALPRKQAEVDIKAKVLCKGFTASSLGPNSSVMERRKNAVSDNALGSKTGKCKAHDFNLSELGNSLGTATRRLAPGILPGAKRSPLLPQAECASAQGQLAEFRAFRSKQGILSYRQLRYAKVSTVNAAVVDGRLIKGTTGGVDSSAPLPTVEKACHEREGSEGERSQLAAELSARPSFQDRKRTSQ